MYKYEFEDLHEKWVKAKSLGLPEAEQMKKDLYAAHWFYKNGEAILKSKFKKTHENGFNVGHFPKGTVVEIQVFDRDTAIQFEVETVCMNAPNHWIVIGKQLTGPENVCCSGYSVSHIKRIIKRGTGDVVFDGSGKMKRPCGFHMRLSDSIYDIASAFISDTQMLDGHGLTVLAENRGLTIAGKKKLKKFVKQNVNRFLIKQRKYREEYDREMDSMFGSTYDVDFNSFGFMEESVTYTKEEMLANPKAKGVLSLAEVKEKLESGRTTFFIIQKGYDDTGVYFFTDDYSFGKQLKAEWVHSSVHLPMEVVARPGLEDGIVDTIEKYIFIFLKDEQRIDTFDALLQYLNNGEEFDMNEFSERADKLNSEIDEMISDIHIADHKYGSELNKALFTFPTSTEDGVLIQNIDQSNTHVLDLNSSVNTEFSNGQLEMADEELKEKLLNEGSE